MLNTILYNRKEETNDEVNKIKGNIPIATPSAAIIPRLSISNNVSAVSSSNALCDRKIDLVTEGIDPFFGSKIRELLEDNAVTIEEVSSPTTYFDANVYHVTKDTGRRTTPYLCEDCWIILSIIITCLIILL